MVNCTPHLYSLPRSKKLLTAYDYRQVFEHQQNFRFANKYFTILAKSNGLEHARIGIVVSKKALKRAHDRNLVKRLVRESFRLQNHTLPSIDIVFLAKTQATTITTHEFFNQLENCYGLMQRYFANRITK
ncbi:ribonuclease P protein component [Psittacicella hinzii]|uniref:Ribonuclease P protein component n=1 Tax=Psittacicella hinzii TaxID=2028575 RepID=A0A3A1YCE1_9GAMM|nr:ribonuclease P protein component [Psittacicella hinzii]RIY34840.1 ribonuclease P protein component [Psittacicella hinzii]